MSCQRFNTETSQIRMKTLGNVRLLSYLVAICVVGGERLLASSRPSVRMNQPGSHPIELSESSFRKFSYKFGQDIEI